MDAAGRGWQAARRSTQALLSIVFAQALHTMGGERSPEPFYRRALGLLDEETAYIPTVDARMPSLRPPHRVTLTRSSPGVTSPCQLPAEYAEVHVELGAALPRRQGLVSARHPRARLVRVPQHPGKGESLEAVVLPS